MKLKNKRGEAFILIFIGAVGAMLVHSALVNGGENWEKIKEAHNAPITVDK